MHFSGSSRANLSIENAQLYFAEKYILVTKNTIHELNQVLWPQKHIHRIIPGYYYNNDVG